MKHVVIQRAWSDHRATLGMLTVIGEEHAPIFTLENPLRETLLDSRIPDGQYNECGPHVSPTKGEVYLIKNVPERTDILIHWGNTESDTRGCILLGLLATTEAGIPRVEKSRIACEMFKQLMGDEEFILTIVPEITQC